MAHEPNAPQGRWIDGAVESADEARAAELLRSETRASAPPLDDAALQRIEQGVTRAIATGPGVPLWTKALLGAAIVAGGAVYVAQAISTHRASDRKSDASVMTDGASGAQRVTIATGDQTRAPTLNDRRTSAMEPERIATAPTADPGLAPAADTATVRSTASASPPLPVTAPSAQIPSSDRAAAPGASDRVGAPATPEHAAGLAATDRAAAPAASDRVVHADRARANEAVGGPSGAAPAPSHEGRTAGSTTDRVATASGGHDSAPGASQLPHASDSSLSREAALLQSAIVALRDRRDPAGALAQLDAYAQQFPSGQGQLAAEVAQVRVEALESLGRIDDALAAISRARRVKLGDDTDWLLVKGELLARAHRCAEAIEAFTAAHARSSSGATLQDARALAGNALCYRALGRPELAAQSARDYLRAFPNGRAASQMQQIAAGD